MPISEPGPVFSDGEIVGEIDDQIITEVSGCAASRIHPDIIYVHNDNGDNATLYAINTTTATVVAVLEIT